MASWHCEHCDERFALETVVSVHVLLANYISQEVKTKDPSVDFVIVLLVLYVILEVDEGTWKNRICSCDVARKDFYFLFLAYSKVLHASGGNIQIDDGFKKQVNGDYRTKLQVWILTSITCSTYDSDCKSKDHWLFKCPR